MPVSCSWREVATTHYTLGGVRGEDGGEGSLVQRQAIAPCLVEGVKDFAEIF